ncbi:unnamed protein product [Protopolystoma xenopodis]|uniref:Kazal-like domain-containing protein n=1 Tax=Protopolystoma xenopodis TaxID=117903 RepID=A0A3S5AEM9_9PLAT|nr:unnamed protein product [Protopolystoma xenopodis]
MTTCRELGQTCKNHEICTLLTDQQASASISLSVPYSRLPNREVYQKTDGFNGLTTARAHCTCPICPEESGLGGKVCGSDSQTYRSECHLRLSACRQNDHSLKVVKRGSCGKMIIH